MLSLPVVALVDTIAMLAGVLVRVPITVVSSVVVVLVDWVCIGSVSVAASDAMILLVCPLVELFIEGEEVEPSVERVFKVASSFSDIFDGVVSMLMELPLSLIITAEVRMNAGSVVLTLLSDVLEKTCVEVSAPEAASSVELAKLFIADETLTLAGVMVEDIFIASEIVVDSKSSLVLTDKVMEVS